MKLGRHEEARVEFERAAALARNARERTLLLDRAATCTADATAPVPGSERVTTTSIRVLPNSW
jgi:hypothetical protein